MEAAIRDHLRRNCYLLMIGHRLSLVLWLAEIGILAVDRRKSLSLPAAIA